jgi:hypothetical protein
MDRRSFLKGAVASGVMVGTGAALLRRKEPSDDEKVRKFYEDSLNRMKLQDYMVGVDWARGHDQSAFMRLEFEEPVRMTQEDRMVIRDLFEQAQKDPHAKIITSSKVKIVKMKPWRQRT